MPFTFAHPAAVLPLSRLPRWLLVPSALAIGSMSPDFWYVLPGLGFGRDSGHNLHGIFRFCLPSSLGLWIAWRLLLGPSLLLLMPPASRTRLQANLHGWRLSDLWAAPLSVVVGAMTHVAWDRLAHDNHSELLPLPDGRLHMLGHQPQIWQVLQVGSSILGMAILGLWFMWTLCRLAPTARWADRLWPGPTRSLALVALFLGPLVLASLQIMPTDRPWNPASLKENLHPILSLTMPLLAGTLATWALLVVIVRLARDADRR